VVRRLFFALPLAVLYPLLAAGQQTESEFYALPKTVPEFWRAAQFEIRTGSYERAAERIKGLLDLNPDDKTLFDLVDRPPPGVPGGMAQFLRLRNIPRWYAVGPRGDDKRNDEAKANVESAIIYGLSSILHERVTIKDGVVEQSNFHDYNVMRMSDLPEQMAVQFVDVDTRPTGLGEIGNPFIAGAISNAFYRLTGKRLRHLPFTPERVLETLKA